MLKSLQIAAIVLGVGFFFAIAGLAYYSSPLNQKPEQTSGQTAGEQLKEKDRSLSGFVNFLFPDSLAIFTFWLVVATILLGFVAYFQLGSLNRSEITAAKSAKAAEDAANVARDAMLTGQRAYVHVTFQRAIVKDTQTKQVTGWNITPVWNNPASTPTRGFRNHISIAAFSGDMPADWNFPDYWPANASRENTLLPLGPQSILNGQTVFFSIQDVRASIAGTKNLYIWGWARYRDVFPNTPDRIVRFANKVVIGGDPTNPEKSSITYPYYHRYNCADDECEHSPFPASWTAEQRP